MWRRLVLPARIGNWSLTSLQQRLVEPAAIWSSIRATIGCFSPRASDATAVWQHAGQDRDVAGTARIGRVQN
jgi:hypothetical protein